MSIPRLPRLITRVLAAAMVIAAAAVTRAAGPVPDVGLFEQRSQVEGFAQVLGPRAFEFPRDHGPHPDYRVEWWYITGNLDGADGERFGFELTFFRYALAPKEGFAARDTGARATSSAQSGVASAWRTRQIYMAHFAITDVARGRFRYWQKLSRGALGLAGAAAEPLHVWVDDWSLEGSSSDAAHWSLQAMGEGYGISLDLQPLLQPVLNGDRGFSRKSDDAAGSASFYYSIPRIAVRGKLSRDGRSIPVSGLAWLDREWWSAGWSQIAAGWDWFALQLGDGSSFMFYGVHDRGGGRDSNSAGTWVDPNGRSRNLSNSEVRIEVLDYWTNSHGERYPSRWRIRAPVVGLDVSVRPVLSDQELEGAPSYWEGAVDVTGANANHSMDGRGYVELVGYAAQ